MDLTRRTVLGAGASFAAASSFGAFAQEASVVAETSAGPVRGLSSQGVHAFKGIRYGESTALSRFAKPIAAAFNSSITDATAYGAACPQRADQAVEDEDCLFLNVWTPALHDGGKRPIMFYIHGGAYSNGSGSDELYDGTHLVNKGDMVVITVNHRLNAFGYLYLDRLFPGEFPDSGNAGQWDLILALNWVKQNAEAFGGDPDRVMVFGQSGGGAKIATMMASPAAEGLFHSAATMSGQQVTACGPLNGTARAQAFIDNLGLSSTVTPELLRTLPMEQIVEALNARDPVNPAHGLYFGPVLDYRMLMRHPFFPDAPSQSAHIPMILGNTKDETKAFLWRDEAFELTWDTLPDWLEAQLRCDILPSHVVTKYREWFPELGPTEIMFKATTAGRSWRGQVEESDARARQGAPTWVYQFDLPAADRQRGAPHTIDIEHAFDNLAQSGAMSGTGPTAARVADQLSTAFINLARNGDPNHAGIPQWDQHTLPDRETMVFDAVTRLENDPRRRERELFATVPFIQWGS
ncbi:carboxylesterase/lipase family protein [Ponticaulis sp.]|uniref:carboxylesterase/lipase family protein n=1 Tax=Ponticaulis sp. TaxID=2020902 RepID=UPI000B74A5C6|nr:carboxylesterase/lipase family protein [Ponticaulis sp.]MAI91522.1 carboxylesterase [Ponticaulis sp.]OUX97483.1 MAG: carboxylesterase [Hyphomonadaceae bacterium TMED5]